MESKSKSITENEDYSKDKKTTIKEEHIFQDEMLTELQKDHFQQNEMCIEECVTSDNVNTKIGTKPESWNPNGVSNNIKTDSDTSDHLPFTCSSTIKGGSEIDIKEEYFNQDKISESRNLHLLQNRTYFVGCGESSEMDTKVGIKQEICESDVISSDIFDPEDFPTCLGTSIIKGDDEIDIKEEAQTDSDNEEKESEPEMPESSKVILQLKSPRLTTESVYHDGSFVTNSDVANDAASDYKTECGKDSHQGFSMRQNIWSHNYNPTCDSDHFDSDLNMCDQRTTVYKCENSEKHLSSQQGLKRDTLLYSVRNPDKYENSHLQGMKQYKCDRCEKSFRWKSHLQRHILLHTGTAPFKCDICEKNFRQKSSLNVHMLLHTRLSPYKCDICDKCFTRNSHLKVHKMHHSGMKPYKCDACEKCFTQKSALKKHTLNVHTKPHKCDTCDKCFSYNSDLQRHKMLHSGIKPYKCDKCESCFPRKSTLQRHMLLHSGTKAYKCDICNKCFTQKSQLPAHKKLHSNAKPHKCDKCEKCFTWKSSLENHTLVHSDIKPYKCETCEKYFSRKSRLESHIMLHSRTKV